MTSLIAIIASTDSSNEVKEAFHKRLQMGRLTRNEDPKSHFIVYFAAFDPKAKQVLIGHHKKSGLWLFNGGHMEKGEIPEEAVIREIAEEWGIDPSSVPKPALLTLTKIEKPQKQICQWHYDIWYFILMNKDSFHPNQRLLAKEYNKIGWKSFPQAHSLVHDPSTLVTLKRIKQVEEMHA